MAGRRARARTRLADWAGPRGLDWHDGTQSSQVATLVALCVGVAAAMVVSLLSYDLMPVATYYVWLLLGMLLLRFRPMVVLTGWVLVAALVAFTQAEVSGARVTATVVLVLAAVLVLYQAARQRSGLPAALSGSLLADLRDLLREQGRVPPLPAGWSAESSMIAAHGASYAGDFMLAELAEDKSRLQMVLVDVCGKGVSAGPRSLQLAGALGGLVRSVPPCDLLGAANRFLLAQESVESFATAVQVRIDLGTGSYAIACAGHPPALRWTASAGEWSLEGARGTALGVIEEPDLDLSTGTLEVGDALMFYTDGVVEARGEDLDTGIEWLRRAAADAVARGFEGAAGRVLREVTRGDDDRAVLIVARPGI